MREESPDFSKIQLDLILKLSSISALDEIFDKCIEAAINTGIFDSGGVYIIQPDGSAKLLVHRGLSKKFTDKVGHVAPEDPRLVAVKEREDVYFNEIPLALPPDDPMVEEGLLMAIAIPIKYQGRLVAILNLASHEISHLSKNDRQMVRALIAVTDGAIVRALAEQAARDSASRLKHIFDNSPYLILVFDEGGILVECNGSTTKVLGYPREEMIGKHFLDLPFMTPESREIISEGYRKLREGHLVPLLECELMKRNGERRWVNISARVLEVNESITIPVFAWDITSQKEAEKILLEENRRLREIDEIRRRFVKNATHELKTPLMCVCGASSFLKESYDSIDEDMRRQLLEHVDRGDKRLKELAERLIDVSLIEEGMLEISKTRENILEIIVDAIRNVRYIAESKKILLESKLPGVPMMLEVDKSLIFQVLLELLFNAIKNTPEKGSVTIEACLDGEACEILVSDTGIGLEREEIEVLFTKFGKLDRTGIAESIDLQGAGLGLFISKNVVEKHGGKIMVESAGRGRGTTFKVVLPLPRAG